MLTKFKSAIHDRVHGAKICRQIKQANAAADSSPADGYETSSASCSDSEIDEDCAPEIGDLGVDFQLNSVCDLRASPFYYYICIGNEGEAASRKKRHGIHASKVIHSKSPFLDPEESGCLLSLAGLTRPEVTVRFSRSAIVGQDTFLGECNFRINLKGASDMTEEFTAQRLLGGGNAVATCSWRIVPFRDDYRRCKILPDESLVTDRDKLIALVDSVRKCIFSLCEDDSEREAKELWLSTLFAVIELDELNELFLNISLVDLIKAVPNIFQSIDKRLCVEGLLPLVRSRIIKSLYGDSNNEPLIADLILSCGASKMREFKYLLSRGGDKCHLMSVIYSTIQSDLLREQILLKFQQSETETRIHVISEIDQIIYSAFGAVRQWPEGPIPGAKVLFQSLSDDVTFVSNKPLSSDSWNHRVIRESGMNDAPLLTGPKSDLYALKGGISKLQSRLESSKYSNWSCYRRLYPEGRFVWFGESFEFAKTLIQDENGKGSSQRFGVGKVVLFVVMGDEGANRVGPRTLDNGIVTCSNFIQAAIACLDHNLIRGGEDVLKNVASQFSQIICKMEKDCVKKGTRHRHLLRERAAELKIDLERFRQRVSAAIPANKNDEIQEIVDSVILTPIEAQSPALTSHSADAESADSPVQNNESETLFALDGL